MSDRMTVHAVGDIDPVFVDGWQWSRANYLAKTSRSIGEAFEVCKSRYGGRVPSAWRAGYGWGGFSDRPLAESWALHRAGVVPRHGESFAASIERHAQIHTVHSTTKYTVAELREAAAASTDIVAERKALEDQRAAVLAAWRKRDPIGYERAMRPGLIGLFSHAEGGAS